MGSPEKQRGMEMINQRERRDIKQTSDGSLRHCGKVLLVVKGPGEGGGGMNETPWSCRGWVGCLGVGGGGDPRGWRGKRLTGEAEGDGDEEPEGDEGEEGAEGDGAGGAGVPDEDVEGRQD